MTNPRSLSFSSLSNPRLKTAFVLGGLALALSACGGGDGGSSGYTLGGSVSALTGDGLILENNGTTLSVASGSSNFQFTGTQSGNYDVTIVAQPTSETCSVANGAGGGSDGGSVTSVAIQCRAYAVFVADSVGDDIAQFTIGADGTLTPAATPTILTNASATSLAVSTDGQHAWAGYLDDKTISDLLIDATGNLSFQSSSTSAASNGFGLALSPSSQTLYAANYGAASISAFSISSTGVATPLGTAVPSGINPYAVVATPDGAHVYATNQSDDSISGYTVGSNGGLTPLTTAATSTTGQGTSPEGIAVGPSSDLLYVTLSDSNKLVAYGVDAATGLLTVKATTTTGTAPRGIAVTTAGTYAYVANFGAGTVSQYSLAAGLLTPLPVTSVAAGVHPSAIAISPDGHYAYVTNTGDGTISQYSISSSGSLTPLTPATISSGGAGPIGIAVR